MNIRNTAKIEILAPNTNMAKVFGDPSNEDRLSTNEGDYRVLKQISEVYESQRSTYSQVIIQSLLYTNLAIEVINDSTIQYDEKIHDAASFIHPVIAAMFLPKIKKFDEYFLLTNLAYIVKNKQLGEPIDTYHNYIMLYNLVTEPTDVVCNIDSPLKDIYQRVVLQIQLYKNVLNLRNKRVYDTAISRVASDFMGTIDICRISNYDAPDLIMVGDESVILRRLLSAFAFRSITVITNPVGFANNVTSLSYPIIDTQVIKISTINVRLPYIVGPAARTINLKNTLQSVQFLCVNGRFELRTQSVIDVDGVIIFNVPRRNYQPLANGNVLLQPTNFSNLPKHALGLEKLNNALVEAEPFFAPVDNVATTPLLFLRSVVCLKTFSPGDQPDVGPIFALQGNKEVIIGSETHVFKYNKEVKVVKNNVITKAEMPTNLAPNFPIERVIKYDPLITYLDSTGARANAVINAAGAFGLPPGSDTFADILNTIVPIAAQSRAAAAAAGGAGFVEPTPAAINGVITIILGLMPGNVAILSGTAFTQAGLTAAQNAVAPGHATLQDAVVKAFSLLSIRAQSTGQYILPEKQVYTDITGEFDFKTKEEGRVNCEYRGTNGVIFIYTINPHL